MTPRILHMPDVARELGRSVRWLHTFVRGKPVGRMVGRSRIFTEGDFAELKTLYKSTAPQRAPSTDLYVIRCGDFVKIGVSNAIRRRLASIKMHCPYPIEVLHTFKKRAHHERNLHKRFKQHRQHGEWFRIEGDVEEWINGGCP